MIETPSARFAGRQLPLRVTREVGVAVLSLRSMSPVLFRYIRSETKQKPVGCSGDFEVFAAILAAERLSVVFVAKPIAVELFRWRHFVGVVRRPDLRGQQPRPTLNQPCRDGTAVNQQLNESSRYWLMIIVIHTVGASISIWTRRH